MDKATVVFHFSGFLIAVVFVVGGALLIAGLRLRRAGGHKRFAWALILFGVIIEALLGPGLINDRIIITGHDYSARTGFWFAPTVRRFEFKDVDYITEGTWTDAKGRRNRQWEVHLKSGSVLDVPTGNLWQVHQKQIVLLLQGRGVRFK